MAQLALFEDNNAQLSVLGYDQASLALVPFVDGHVDRSQPVTIAYQAEVDGRIRRVAVTLTPGANDELPSQNDQMVLLALLQLAHERNANNELSFRRSELLRTVGWGKGGRDYNQLWRAMLRLTRLTIEFQSAFVSRSGGEYRKSGSAAHIIDSFELADEGDAMCTVRWGHVIKEAFRLGDFKRLDWQLTLALDNPLTVTLYRLLDRVVLSGETLWRTGWKSLATALGMSQTAYARPARFRQVLEPHIERLQSEGVISEWEYQRGGQFVFHLPNYLRSQLRRILVERGVYPEAARQLLSGYDELAIIRQVDAAIFKSPASLGGYLTEAIRQGYDLSYPDDEVVAFVALVDFSSSELVRAAVRLAERLSGMWAGAEPAAWPDDIRAVVRFCLTTGIDPELCAALARSGDTVEPDPRTEVPCP